MTERLRPLLTRFLGPSCTGVHISAKKAILHFYAVVDRNVGMTVGSARAVGFSFRTWRVFRSWKWENWCWIV